MPKLPAASTRVPSRSTLKACSAFALTYAALAVLMSRMVAPYDEGIILVGAEQVQRGYVPYRDFYANYGPANFYILAGLFDVFGDSVLVERAWDTVVRAATVPVCFLLVRHAAPRWVAWVAALLATAWLGSLGDYGYPVFPSLLCCLAGLLCIARASEASEASEAFGAADPWRWLFAAGCAAGAAASFRFDAGVYAVGALAVSSALSAGWRRAAVPFTAGVATLCVPVALALSVAGAVPDLIYDNLLFPSRAYAATRSLPFPSVSDLAAYPYQVAVYVPITAVALSLAALALDARRRSSASRAARWLLLSLAMMSSVLYLKGLVRVSVTHVALSLLPAILLAVASAVLVRRGATAINVLVALSLAIVAVPSVYAVGKDAKAGRATLAWASSPATWTDPDAPASCRPPPHIRRLRCFAADRAWSSVVATIEARSRADQPIYVGLAHHDRVFVDDVLTYFAAERRPVTKWYHFDPGLQTTAAIQAQIVADLRASRPPVAVLDDTWSGIREPNASALSSGVTLLDDYLSRTFRSIDRRGPYDVRVPRSD